MYSVHAVVFKTLDGNTSRHEVLIHDSMSPIHEHHLIDPKLTMADLEAGKFTATVPPYNPGYSLLERFNTIIKVHKGTKLIWTGRIITESSDFWNRRSINCEGALAFLNDTVQPIANYGSGRSPAYILSTLLNIHNSKTVVDREIYTGSVDDFPDDDYGTFVFETNNESTFEALKKNIVDRLDCHISMHYTNNKAYLDIYSDYPNTAVQQINFGDNLLDFTKDWNLSGLVTTILPRGKQIDTQTNQGQTTYLTLKSSNDDISPIADGNYAVGGDDTAVTVDGPFLINNALYSQYGRVEKVVDFNDSEDPQDLFILAKNYLTSMQFDNMTLKVNAVDLHNLTKEIVSFELLDQVYCISKPHGLYGRFFPIVEMDIPLDHPENVTYTLTDCLHKATLSGSLGAIKGAFGSVKSGIDQILSTTNSILDIAKVEASSIINRKTTGYVSIINMHESEEEGIAQAIVISNLPNWQEASKYWIWNMNGLAYYDANRSAAIGQTAEATGMVPKYSEKDGDRYYDLAITMDGTIIANRIKTGIISDGLGYNYWNLETGAFSLMPGAQFRYGNDNDDYVSIFDLIYGIEKGSNKRSGSTNYLSGCAYFDGWEKYGEWTRNSQNANYAVYDNYNKKTFEGYSYIASPLIQYNSINGYTMTFSIEGSLEHAHGWASNPDGWGEISPTNAFVVIFQVVLQASNGTGAGTVLGSTERVFSFDADWSRRYVTIDVLPETFNWTYSDYPTPYLRIVLENRSQKRIEICKPQFERGNTPTDWSPSEKDVNDKVTDVATISYNNNTSDIREKINNLRVEVTNKTSEMKTNIKNAIDDAQGDIDDRMQKATKEIDDKIRIFENKVLEASEITDGQIEAFNISLNQSLILDKLTDGGTLKAIYYDYDKNLLMINADYIRSGTLEGGILKVGEIIDQKMNNRWNLERGYMKVTNGEFTNVTTSGQMSSDNGMHQIEMTEGVLALYFQNNLCGRFVQVLQVGNRGYSRRGDRGLNIEASVLGLWNKTIEVYDTGHGRMGYGLTGSLDLQYVAGVDIGSGNVRFGSYHMEFINGILVGTAYPGGTGTIDNFERQG